MQRNFRLQAEQEPNEMKEPTEKTATTIKTKEE